MEVVKMRWQGLQKLQKRIGEANLEYQSVGGTELFRSQDKNLQNSCLANIGYCNELIADHLSLTSCYHIALNKKLPNFDPQSIYNQYEGIINPVTMMNTLNNLCGKLGITIVYGVHVTQLDTANHVLITDENLHINYQKLIVCTNGFTKRLLPEIDVLPARNQVLMTSPLQNLPLNSGYHVDKGYIYFRQFQNRILLGGGRNLDPMGETTDQFGNTDQIKEYLLEILEQIYPGASTSIDHWWSGILGVGQSKYPILQWHDKDVLIGVRLGGMGVAIGSYLGEQLAEMMLEE